MRYLLEQSEGKIEAPNHAFLMIDGTNSYGGFKNVFQCRRARGPLICRNVSTLFVQTHRQ